MTETKKIPKKTPEKIPGKTTVKTPSADEIKKIKVKSFTINLSPKNIMSKGFLYIFLGLLFLPFLLSLFTGEANKEISLSTLVSDVREDKIEKIGIAGKELRTTYKDGTQKVALKEEGQDVVSIYKAADIDLTKTDLEIQSVSIGSLIWELALSFLPVVLMIVVFLFIFRQAKGGQDGILGIGKSKAKLFVKGKQNTKFTAVGGMDEAKAELEEIVDFLKNPKKYTKMGARTPKGVLLVGPAGTGKCVVGDTLITTNKGLIEIEDIPKYYYVDSKSNKVYGSSLASFNIEKTSSEKNIASHWFNLGEQKTVKLDLTQGFSIEGTPEHPVVVMTEFGKLEFKKLKDIQLDDNIVIQYGRNLFGNSDLIDKETAYLMGLLTGDGNLSHSSRVGLTSVDEEIINFFKKYVAKNFPKAKVSQNGQSYLVANWSFKKHLYELGMSYLLSFDKTVPSTVLQSPKEIQVSFLKGLFDADASIGKSRAEFEYTTVSSKMARQVQMILLNLGVIASLSQKGKVENGYKRPVYRIVITGQGLLDFGKTVGFGLTRKSLLLREHTYGRTKVNTNIDIIPGIAECVVESWKVISAKKLSNEDLSKTIDKVRRRSRVSRQTLKEYVEFSLKLDIDVPDVSYFQDLLNNNLFFVKVAEKSFSSANVYDFTVPGTHSFLGNGLINHNTLLARAVAGEAGVQFLSIAGSEFMEMLVGVGASRVRDLFTTAKKLSPAIIFIDEIDAIGRARGRANMGGHDEREQTLNQILVEMDGFSQNDNVIVVAATNRGDMLDPALVRPGRFDRRVMVALPDLIEREFIIKIHAKNKPFVKDLNWATVAKRTVGFSGADIENMLNEAAISVAREKREEITQEDIEEAALKVKLGPSKKRLQDELEKEMTAYHEIGHSIVAHVSPHADPVHRVSIISRGSALGFTLTPPEKDKLQTTKSELMDDIAVLLGGRGAEKLIFNELTAGASSDIQKATKIARAMVMDFGMSPLGPMNFSPQYEVSYSTPWGEPAKISEKLQEKVDEEIKKIIDAGQVIADNFLKKYRKQLDSISKKLIEVESLDGDEFEKLIGMPKAKNEARK